MRILALDVGTGTQDILLFDTSVPVENCVKMVMPSPTTTLARNIEEATRRQEALLLTGVTMGGGPCAWAAERHIKAGLPLYATPEAARTFDDHLENVEDMGVRLVSEDEARCLQGVRRLEMKDLDLAAVGRALESFGVEPGYDAVAVAVFDHGAAPRDMSDRVFRFQHLRQTLERDNNLYSFGYLAHEVPRYLTRMKAVVSTFPLDIPLLLLDTAPAGAIGAQDDPAVKAHEERLIVNLGNMHTTAFHLRRERVVGLFEHHTGLVDRHKLERLLERLTRGILENEEVFDDQGHGAHVWQHDGQGQPFLCITGPQRRLLLGSPLQPYPAAPHGDMMLSGCFGLVRCLAYKIPEWREEIERALAAEPSVAHSHAH